jgi:hypothetical protein
MNTKLVKYLYVVLIAPSIFSLCGQAYSKPKHVTRSKSHPVTQQNAKQNATIASLRRELALKDKIILALYDKQNQPATPPPGSQPLDDDNGPTPGSLDWQVQAYNRSLYLAQKAHENSMEMAAISKNMSEYAAKLGISITVLPLGKNPRSYTELERSDDDQTNLFLNIALYQRENLLKYAAFGARFKEGDLCFVEKYFVYSNKDTDLLRFYVPQ